MPFPASSPNKHWHQLPARYSVGKLENAKLERAQVRERMAAGTEWGTAPLKAAPVISMAAMGLQGISALSPLAPGHLPAAPSA